MSEINRRVLVVDDTPEIHDDYRHILSPAITANEADTLAADILGGSDSSSQAKLSFVVDCVSQGQEALTLVEKAVADGKPYAMAFVDIRMPPGWDGVETIKRIWQVDPDIQVTIVTAYSDYSWQEMIEQLGATDKLLVLKKPFESIEIQQIASSLTDKWNLLLRIKKGAVKLAAKSRELELFFSSALDLLCIADTDGHFRKLNPEWEKVLGYPVDELIGSKFLDFIHPDDLEGTLQAIATLSDQNPLLNFTNRYRHKDGSYRWLEWRSFPSGKMIYASAHDITERKKLLEQLEMSEKEYHSLVSELQVAVVVHDADTQITLYNDSACDLLGLTADQMEGKTAFDPAWQFVDEDGEALEPEMYPANRAISSKESVKDLMLGIHRPLTNDLVWVLVSARPVLNDMSEVAEVVVTFIDVTRRKLAEQLLNEEKDFSESIVNTAQTIVLILNPDATIQYINRYMEELSGYSLDEVKGKDWFNTFLPKKDWSEIRQVFKSAISETSTRGVINPIITKDGEERLIEWNDSPIRDAKDQVIGLLSTGQDITERIRAVEELKEANRRFKGLADASPLAIYLSSAGVEQRGEYINPAFTKLFGYTLDEVPSVAEWWPRAYPDESYRQQIAEEWKAKVETAIANKSEIEPMVTLVTCKDGSEKKVQWGFISTGKVDCSFGLNLTEIEKAHDDIRRSEQRLAEAQRLAHLGNWKLDLATNNLDWSNEVFRIFEIDKDQFDASYDTFLQAIHPDDRELVNRAYQESVKNMEPYEIVHRLLMKDGRVKYVSEHGETHYDKTGTPLYSIGTVHDITDIKKVEEELNKLNQELEQRVEERTAELNRINKRLEGFNELMADREMRVIEVKHEVNRLCRELGRDPLYGETEKAIADKEEGE